MKNKEYEKLIESKTESAESFGFDPFEFTASLKPFQKSAVEFAIKKGRCALFEDTGLGKTRQQLEWAHQVVKKTGKPVLILTKLAVVAQTILEGDVVGIQSKHAKTPSEISVPGIYITNYEKIDQLKSCGIFDCLGGIVLDESSILKNFTGKMSTSLRNWCSSIPFRLCATATPAPNDWQELGNHSEFLGIMSSAKMLATWFINDTSDTGEWRLKKHARKDFWRWVGTWAACIFKPSDVGDSDDGYDLPGLEIHEERFDLPESEITKTDDALFDLTTVNAMNQAKLANKTLQDRVSWIAEKVTYSSMAWCVFVETNEEADALSDELEMLCCNFAEVRGSDDEDEKASLLYKFSTGEVRVMVTKCKIAGFGLNWQHCHNVIFATPSYSFEQWYQSVRRFYRFGQKEKVQCYMLRGSNMESVSDVWRKKMDQFDKMKNEMRSASAQLVGHKKQGMECNKEIKSKSGKNWTLYNGDCVRVSETLDSDSVDFSIFSPPFADLFTYSNDVQDMGNCSGMEEFMAQFKFLVDDLLRITSPGRLCAVHCVDLLATKWKDGYIGYKDFSGAIVRAFMESGWVFWSRVSIWKCPVIEMTRTKAHGLLYKTLKKDSADSRIGSAEYLLVFKKPGENKKPITHNPEDFPVNLWQEYASPFWKTIEQGDVLNRKRGENDEKHICPLQLGVIRRALTMWSAKDDVVFSPFTGVGSEGFESLKMNRRFIGSELKKEYFDQACDNLSSAEGEASQDLFAEIN